MPVDCARWIHGLTHAAARVKVGDPGSIGAGRQPTLSHQHPGAHAGHIANGVEEQVPEPGHLLAWTIADTVRGREPSPRLSGVAVTATSCPRPRDGRLHLTHAPAW